MKNLLTQETINNLEQNRTNYTTEELKEYIKYNKHEIKRERILYKDYKQNEGIYRTVKNTYDKETKTIEVEYVKQKGNVIVNIDGYELDCFVEIYPDLIGGDTVLRDLCIEFQILRVDDEQFFKLKLDDENEIYFVNTRDDKWNSIKYLIEEKGYHGKKLMNFKKTLCNTLSEKLNIEHIR